MANARNQRLNKKLLSAAILAMLVLLPVVTLLHIYATLNFDPLPIGKLIPPLTLIDNKGGVVRLEGLRGAKCALLFFTADCPHCRRVLSALARLDSMFRDSVNIIYVSLSGKDQTERLLREEHVNVPVFFANESSVREQFRIRLVPSLSLVDERGVLLGMEFGVRLSEKSEQLLKDFTANRLSISSL